MRAVQAGYVVQVANEALATIHVSRPPTYHDVRDSARHIYRQHAAQVRRLGIASWLKFASSLQVECASAAAKNDKFLFAAVHTSFGIALWPLRNRAFWSHVLRRLVARRR